MVTASELALFVLEISEVVQWPALWVLATRTEWPSDVKIMRVVDAKDRNAVGDVEHITNQCHWVVYRFVLLLEWLTLWHSLEDINDDLLLLRF